jgi:molybdate transport system regulatory protein
MAQTRFAARMAGRLSGQLPPFQQSIGPAVRKSALKKKMERAAGNAALSLRVDFGAHGAIGPGKIRLLELIGRHGSISTAGRAMEMSYRRAWLLVENINRSFREPAVSTQRGGTDGGGAALTPFGRDLIARYRAIESDAASAVESDLRALSLALAKTPPATQPSPPRRRG